MKLFIQIPCLNEEQTLPAVLETIPRSIPGIDEIEILVIDDGSTDRTVEVAKAHGVTHFVRHAQNMGLARSFRDGVDYALLHGADIVVNTDGDNQYPQAQIADLVLPILEKRAEIVIGDRQTRTIEHFSGFKKLMQRFGSWVASRAAGLDLPDAASGFRAYSKYSLIRLNIVTRFSYCMETIVQAGYKRIAIASVPITTNAKTRESRLFSNIWQHMFESGSAIARVYLMYRPMALFASVSAVLAVCGLIPFIRYLVLLYTDSGGDHLQSLLLGLVLVITAVLAMTIGVVADLTRLNRTLAEEQLDLQKLARYGD
ncbi:MULTISPECIES: glycosyltransferase family 2 protein [unclassified Curtobacterium]|uniref:glycosyltransferase family 2 protein n=1 Tax=unclassified Curtobacterium TaxID=257496 RepID=UPI000D8F97BC|nr:MULTISPECIES: glycosyltransferase family 2 protein [unclassified Curtobacterium]PYY37341.1 glycosyltransferase family 2 protein [Curtobacterium sp. MCBD17_030]PZE36197.1 glycosyltransferase family 2 protein [Curtobacterium sp. MCPF17_031]